jgi:hypothetical protein
MRREPHAVALALDDNLVADVGEVVEGAVAEDGVLEEAEPFLTARLEVMTKLETRCLLMINW